MTATEPIEAPLGAALIRDRAEVELKRIQDELVRLRQERDRCNGLIRDLVADEEELQRVVSVFKRADARRNGGGGDTDGTTTEPGEGP